MKNPLQVLAEMYQTHLKQADEAGCAELYKRCTELFIDKMLNPYDPNDTVFHVEDVEYLDGYFIFASGTNSVVHFHIKECPGWKFGIWWSVDGDSKEIEKVNYSFFTQYELFIDKFKPTASCMNADGSVRLSSCEFDPVDIFWSCQKIINYIYSEPELAFCRDICWIDYNLEYMSREDAKKKMEEVLEDDAKSKAIKHCLDSALLDYYKENIVPLIPHASILYAGDNCWPEYELRAPFSSLSNTVVKPGHYDLIDILPKLGGNYKDLREYELVLYDRAEKEDVYWSIPIDSYIYVYNDYGDVEEDTECSG